MDHHVKVLHVNPPDHFNNTVIPRQNCQNDKCTDLILSDTDKYFNEILAILDSLCF